jgi:hypothetical protein
MFNDHPSSLLLIIRPVINFFCSVVSNNTNSKFKLFSLNKYFFANDAHSRRGPYLLIKCKINIYLNNCINKGSSFQILK